MAETEKTSRLKEKIAEVGGSLLSSILEKRKKKNEEKDAALREIAEKGIKIKRNIDAVELGLSPDLEEQGIPMKSATGLLSEVVNPSLKGTDVKTASSGMLKSLTEEITSDKSGQWQRILEQKKSRIVHGSIARRNPEAYIKSGPGGFDTEPISSVMKQIARQRQLGRGGKYES